jgi:hypothetical protein
MMVESERNPLMLSAAAGSDSEAEELPAEPAGAMLPEPFLPADPEASGTPPAAAAPAVRPGLSRFPRGALSQPCAAAADAAAPPSPMPRLCLCCRWARVCCGGRRRGYGAVGATGAVVDAAAVYRYNFVAMAFALSLNHASVVACLNLSVSTLGEQLGNISNAVLYIAYTAAALLGASGTVRPPSPDHILKSTGLAQNVQGGPAV